MVRLKNGSEVPQNIVMTTMISLRGLLDGDGIEGELALYDLLAISKDGSYNIYYSREILQRFELLDVFGNPYSSTRDIVLSAIVLNEETSRISIIDPIDAHNFVGRINRGTGGSSQERTGR